MFDVVLLLLVTLLLVDLLLQPSLHVGAVVAAVQLESLAAGQVVDLGAHAVEEVGRVGGHDEDRLPLGKVVLEPHARAQVEMISGLIENEQHGTHEERLRQRDAHAPAARHVLGHPVHHRLRKAQAEEQLARALLKGVRVHLVELVVDGL